MSEARKGEPVTAPWQRTARQVLEIEAEAIRGLLDQLGPGFDRAIETMQASRGRIACTGMGKSGHVMKKIAATLASTGTPALFVHPAEAIHGDLGMIVPGDVVLAASFSGATSELLEMVEPLRAKGVPLIAITGQPGSPLAAAADVHLPAVIDQEACPLNLAPTASTTATLALGDALAMALLEARGFTPDDFAVLHPGGQLGRRLSRVEQVMHRGDAVPSIESTAPLSEGIYEMSRKGLGITGVVDESGRLAGVISDGDLRRLLQTGDSGLLERPAAECMKHGPKTIGASERVGTALRRMEDHRITSLFVCDDEQRPIGVVHIHDLWGLLLK